MKLSCFVYYVQERSSSLLFSLLNMVPEHLTRCCFFRISIGDLKKHEDNAKNEKKKCLANILKKNKVSFFVSIQNQSKFLLDFSLLDQKNKYALSEIISPHFA